MQNHRQAESPKAQSTTEKEAIQNDKVDEKQFHKPFSQRPVNFASNPSQNTLSETIERVSASNLIPQKSSSRGMISEFEKSSQQESKSSGQKIEDLLKAQISKLEQQFKEQEAKYENKLHLKDNELTQLKVQLGATNILQKQLKKKDDKIEKLNTELHESKKDSLINPHQQCNQVIQALEGQLKTKDEYWIKMFMELYNSSKQPDFHQVVKDKLEKFAQSLQNSKVTSIISTPNSEQDEHMNVDEEVQNQFQKAKQTSTSQEVSDNDDDGASQDILNYGIQNIVGLKNRGNTCYLNTGLQVLQKLWSLEYNQLLFDKDEGVKTYSRFYKSSNYFVTKDSFEVLSEIINSNNKLKSILQVRITFLIQCSNQLCKHTHYQIDDGFNLNLSIKNTLEESFIEFKKPEHLDAYICDKCLKNSCTKGNSQIKFGKYLLLRMNRFNRLGDKLSDKIKFPTSFDMEGKLLQLIAYGVHFGNSTGLNVNDQVHYKSYVKGVNETWTEIDDGVIKSLSEEDELSIRGSAYFCLYSFVDIGKAQTKQQSEQKTSNKLGKSIDIADALNKPQNSQPHKSEGYMQWVDDELVNVTEAVQQNNMIKQRLQEFRYRCAICNKLFSCQEGWVKHKDRMMLYEKTTCVCDIFKLGKYSCSVKDDSNIQFQREFKDGELEDILVGVCKTYPKSISTAEFRDARNSFIGVQVNKANELQNTNSHKAPKRSFQKASGPELVNIADKFNHKIGEGTFSGSHSSSSKVSSKNNKMPYKKQLKTLSTRAKPRAQRKRSQKRAQKLSPIQEAKRLQYSQNVIEKMLRLIMHKIIRVEDIFKPLKDMHTDAPFEFVSQLFSDGISITDLVFDNMKDFESFFAQRDIHIYITQRSWRTRKDKQLQDLKIRPKKYFIRLRDENALIDQAFLTNLARAMRDLREKAYEIRVASHEKELDLTEETRESIRAGTNSIYLTKFDNTKDFKGCLYSQNSAAVI